MRTPGMGIRSGAGMPSPSQNPKGFGNSVNSSLTNMVNQLGSHQMQGRVGLPDFGAGQHTGPKRRRHVTENDYGPQDPASAANPQFGSEAFGTYAPGINGEQFQNENFKKQGLKGMGGPLDQGFGGLMGSMGGGMGSGMGSGMMGGNPMDLISFLFPMLGQMQGEDEGPIRGR